MTDGTGCLSVCGKQSRRDYLLVEKYDAPTVRMPSGMRPVQGCIRHAGTGKPAFSTKRYIPNGMFKIQKDN